MERVVPGEGRSINPSQTRRIAGFAVLALMLVIAVALIPPYWRNWQFQRWLDDFAERPPAFEQVQAAVIEKAAASGLPVRTGDVHVQRSGNGVHIDIVYVVRVDFPLYTVDLHFHPSAESE